MKLVENDVCFTFITDNKPARRIEHGRPAVQTEQRVECPCQCDCNFRNERLFGRELCGKHFVSLLLLLDAFSFLY